MLQHHLPQANVRTIVQNSEALQRKNQIQMDIFIFVIKG